MRTAEEAYRSILNFCKGYESNGKEKGDDYYTLKRFAEEELEKIEEDNNGRM